MSLRETQQRIQEQLRKLPQVDAQGTPVPAAAPVQQQNTPTNLIDSLMDSRKFTEAFAQLDPSDTVAVQSLIANHLDPKLGMRPNAVQGSSGSTGKRSATAPRPKQTLLESLQEQFGPKEEFDYSAQTPID